MPWFKVRAIRNGTKHMRGLELLVRESDWKRARAKAAAALTRRWQIVEVKPR